MAWFTFGFAWHRLLDHRRRRIIATGVRGDHADLLSNVNLFRGLDRVALAKVAGNLEPLRVAAGISLFLQGEPGDGLYLVSHGSFGVYARPSPDAEDMLLNIIHHGEAVGEMALLSDEPRNATVRAEEDSEALRLPKARFLELVRRDPSVGLAISAALIKRLRIADAVRLGTMTPDAISPVTKAASPVQRLGAAPPAGWRSRVGQRTIGLMLGLLLTAGGWLAVPPPAGLGAPGWHALVSVIGVVPMLALDALPEGAIALLLAAVWGAGGVAPPGVALSGFSSTTWVLTVAIFIVGAAIASSGLLYRLALWAVTRTASFRRQVLALGLSGFILGPAVPTATGRMSLAAHAVGELTEALGYEPGSGRAAGLAMAALVGYGQMVAPFLTSSSIALLAFALLPDASRAELSWAGWAMRAAPLHLVLLTGLLGVVLWGSAGPGVSPPRQRPEQTLALQRALLGRPSRAEIVAALVSVSLLLGFATQPLHGVDPAWIAIAAIVIMAAARVMTVETLRIVNWSTVLLLGTLAGIGNVFRATKLDAWLANVLVDSVAGVASAPLVFVLALAILCLALSLVLRWQAAVPIIIVALSPVARTAGIDPWVVAIVTLTASNTFFMPYQSTIYMALYSGTGERLFRHAQVRPLSVAYAFLVLAGLAAGVPFWRTLGLL